MTIYTYSSGGGDIMAVDNDYHHCILSHITSQNSFTSFNFYSIPNTHTQKPSACLNKYTISWKVLIKMIHRKILLHYFFLLRHDVCDQVVYYSGTTVYPQKNLSLENVFISTNLHVHFICLLVSSLIVSPSNSEFILNETMPVLFLNRVQ